MELIKYQDCYFSFENNTLIIGNDFIERKIYFSNNLPITDYILNKATGFFWRGNVRKIIMINNGLNWKECYISVSHNISDNEGLSEQHLRIEVKLSDKALTVKYVIKIFPQIPFITSRTFIKGQSSSDIIYDLDNDKKLDGIENNYVFEDGPGIINSKFDSIDSFSIKSTHLKVEAVKLLDRTDENDSLIEENKFLLYPRRETSFEGNLFIIEDYINKEGLMIVKEAPTVLSAINRKSKDLFVKPGEYVQIIGTGIDYSKLSDEFYMPCYGSSVGVGKTEDLKSLYKRLYGKVYIGDLKRDLFIMSNTWGDRNQDKAVCKDFLIKEIETAKKLGIDIVQIDDGWQKGVTANSALVKGGVWEGYYSSDESFWNENMTKFPEGLNPIVKLALSYGIKLGLWFSPDSSNDFDNWQKDAEVLLHYYKKYNICYFKLDGIKIRTKLCEVNLINFLTRVSRESDNKISFNMDITAETRFGFLYEKQFGTIFVENRYTDWSNYYPHNTLKNLWCISKFMPTRKYLFEVLNNKRNTEKYNDILAPINYSMDYIFATTMVSNPLIWMEMSNLNKEDKVLLARIIEIYKIHRKDIFDGEVIPVGDMPDGCSFTGFQIKTDEENGILLLFRENTEEKQYIFSLNGISANIINYDYLYSNVEFDTITLGKTIFDANKIKVNFDRKRSFIFVKYQVNFLT